MWLWSDIEYFTFDVSRPVSGHESYRTDEQFAPLATELARQARDEAQALRQLFPDLSAAVTYAATQSLQRGQFWEAWHAGVFAALSGQVALAEERFSIALAEDPLAAWMVDAQQIARELRANAADPEFIKAWAIGRINSCRAKLGLDSAASLTGDLVWR
jgi:hypothetical protein